MELTRSSGILLHISSLPGKFGIGDLGKEAYNWVDFLDRTGTKYWQILPLNPTGYGNSPYQGLSAFAGNPLFINLDSLQKMGLLSDKDLSDAPDFPIEKVDFSLVNSWKREKLETAYKNYLESGLPEIQNSFHEFKESNSQWLDEFTLFMALRENHKLISWINWPQKFKMRDEKALKKYREKHQRQIEMHAFLQFLFIRQWKDLKEYANSREILIIGDIPIFMGFDCSDVWAYPELFLLDNERHPTHLAGVPPDFFSERGQLWGNPLYDWEKHKGKGYSWWIRRIKETLKTVDLIRLDHFRGFSGFYKIPAEAETAEKGEWVDGPGKSLFDTMQDELGNLPFIAEDLGVITSDVIELRDRYNFPGMKLFQFAFCEDADAEFLPHTYPRHCVAYTGTHDSDTSRSWFDNAPEHERRFCASYLGYHTENIAHEMIRMVWSSVAEMAVAPMQDFLQLGNEARMNLPASTTGNWEWRMKPDEADRKLAEWIKEINITFNRGLRNKDWSAKEYFSRKIQSFDFAEK